MQIQQFSYRFFLDLINQSNLKIKSSEKKSEEKDNDKENSRKRQWERSKELKRSETDSPANKKKKMMDKPKISFSDEDEENDDDIWTDQSDGKFFLLF